MGKVTIDITEGGLNRPSANYDNYAGIILEVDALPAGWLNDAVETLTKVEDLTALAVLNTGTASDKFIYYHVSEFFRLNPTGTLLVALTTDAFDVAKLDLIVNENNNVRLIGYNPQVTTVLVVQIDALQTKLETMFDTSMQPVRCVYSGTIATNDPSTATGGASRVLYDCMQDLTVGSFGKAVFDANSSQCGATGTILGLLAGRPVHQKMSWVASGDISGLDWTSPGLIDGTTSTLLLTQAAIDAYLVKGINVVRTYPRSTGSFMSGTRCSTLTTNDYAVFNYGRVVDKAAILVYNALLPSVDRPAYINPTTGKLNNDTIEFLRMAAYNAIQDNMIAGKSGNDVELSVDPNTGRLQDNAIYIDPAQNVLSNETINITIGVVPVGSSKIINITIGLENPA